MLDTRTPVEAEMIRRVRRHMLTSIGGILLTVVVAGVAGGIARSAALAPAVGGLLVFGAMLLIPIIGFTSTFRNLRCPKCNGLVVFQVSAQYSWFGRFAPKTCRHCGEKIFADDIPQRFRRFALIMLAIGIGTGLLGVIANVVTSAH